MQLNNHMFLKSRVLFLSFIFLKIFLCCLFGSLIEALEKYFKGQWSQMKSDPQFSERVGYSNYVHELNLKIFKQNFLKNFIVERSH